MRNRKGFTLVELLAVVVILGILMMIAIPNTITLIDKNKMTSYIENAKTFVSLVQNKVQTDKSLELPLNENEAFIMTLEYLNTNDIEETPYGGIYSEEASFVSITLKEGKYVYHVHLVSCNTGTETCSFNDPNQWRGIELTEISLLNSDDKFNYVKSTNVNGNLIHSLSGNALFATKSLDVKDKGE